MDEHIKEPHTACIDSIQEGSARPKYYDRLGRFNLYPAKGIGPDKNEAAEAAICAMVILDVLRASDDEQARFDFADEGSDEQRGANPLSPFARDALIRAARQLVAKVVAAFEMEAAAAAAAAA